MRTKLLRARQKSGRNPVDLRPFAAWEFNGNLKDSVGRLHLTAHGTISYKEGMVVLNKSFLESPKLPFDLKAKTLEVWCLVPDINQRGGGVMGIQGPGDFFDTIVLGERKPRHWISGSNGFARTTDFPESYPEEMAMEKLHLAMVYQEDGTTPALPQWQTLRKAVQQGRSHLPERPLLRHLRPSPPATRRQSLSPCPDRPRPLPTTAR